MDYVCNFPFHHSSHRAFWCEREKGSKSSHSPAHFYDVFKGVDQAASLRINGLVLDVLKFVGTYRKGSGTPSDAFRSESTKLFSLCVTSLSAYITVKGALKQ
jgi:hypothetical protein